MPAKTTVRQAARDWATAIPAAYALARERQRLDAYAAYLALPVAAGVGLLLVGWSVPAAAGGTVILELLMVTHVTRGQRRLQQVLRNTRAHRVTEVVQVVTVADPAEDRCATSVSSLETEMEFLDDDCLVLHRQTIQLARNVTYPLPAYLFDQLREVAHAAKTGTVSRLLYDDGTIGSWQMTFDEFTVETGAPC